MNVDISHQTDPSGKWKKEPGAKKNEKWAKKGKGGKEGKSKRGREQGGEMWKEQGARTPPLTEVHSSQLTIHPLCPVQYRVSCIAHACCISVHIEHTESTHSQNRFRSKQTWSTFSLSDSFYRLHQNRSWDHRNSLSGLRWCVLEYCSIIFLGKLLRILAMG